MTPLQEDLSVSCLIPHLESLIMSLRQNLEPNFHTMNHAPISTSRR